jgi:arsenical pump membrane protein
MISYSRIFALAGIAAAVAAFAADPTPARAAVSQDWSPFVLVAGLLLVGLVAEEDRLFSAAGIAIARVAPNPFTLYLSAMSLVAVVTAVLNLDTSVAFLTPVLLHASRSRRLDDTPFLYGCILLSNASSLLLPGSNLTNLIVLGHLHLSGARFFYRMAPPWAAAVVATILLVGLVGMGSLRAARRTVSESPHPVVGLGAVSVAAVTVLVLVLRSPAPYVGAVGLLAICIRIASRPERVRAALEVLGVPVLLGLFAVAVALGTLGRSWTSPATWIGRLGTWETAFLAAGISILVNNLPAASFLAARVPAHPFALLLGLDIGPNLFVTGSLAWIVWFRAARTTGARPSLQKAGVLGVSAGLLALVAAAAVLGLAHLR